MIRRGFWLTAGAVTGVYGYRRVSALGRRLSASLNPASSLKPASGLKPASPAQARLATGARRSAIRAARETYRFTRDVREGMELYMARHSTAAGSTLSTGREATGREATRREATTTTYEPEDGR